MSRKKSCESALDAPAGHHLVELFWQLGPGFTRWAESHMDQPGLTAQRVRLLAELLENGPLTMGDLAARLGVTATNVTALVDALEKDGMARRQPHPTDRRAILIAITDKAETQMTENCAAFKARVATLFDGLNTAEQQTLRILLDRVRAALEERNILTARD